jgi:hypothetical protein
MAGARALAVVVLLLSYGAVGARQPAVRTAAPLGVAPSTLATTLGLTSADRSSLLIDVVRMAFDSPDGLDAGDVKLRAELRNLFNAPRDGTPQTVPLPLDPAIWRETIVGRQVPDDHLIPTIFSDRATALFYYGLAALDDETLAALGPDRDTLHHLLRHAGSFAAFGRSLRIHAGRIVVPGGAEAEPLWQSIVGVEPERPAAFARRLFDDPMGRLAFLYDTIAHLDQPHQRFALGAFLPAAARLDRLRALLEVFQQVSADWRADDRPFMRPPMNPAVTLSVIAVSGNGSPIGPAHRRLWNRLFRPDERLEANFNELTSAEFAGERDPSPIDAAWIASRVHRAPALIGRRRLDTFLFAQRTLSAAEDDDAAVATALNGFVAYPTLMLELEQIGATSVPTLTRAAVRAKGLGEIRDEAARQVALSQFQAALGIIGRAARTGGLPPDACAARASSLIALDVSERGYEGRIGDWIRRELMESSPSSDSDAPVEGVLDTVEDGLLAAMAGVRSHAAPAPVVQWEGRAYRVDPARAELLRLRRIRHRQRGLTLDAALEAMPKTSHSTGSRNPRRDASKAARDARLSATPDSNDIEGSSNERGRVAGAERALAQTLASILYAAYLGDPDGAALEGGNVALRHNLETSGGAPRRLYGAWRLPSEEFGSRGGWHLSGSLLGLDTALVRLSLRRLDSGAMPLEPKLSTNERRTAMTTAALLNPRLMTDAARDEIAAALARGRARLTSMTGDRDELERVARDAGLSEWRREALAWTLAHDRDHLLSHVSFLELLWLGAPRPSEAAPLDPWGASMLPLTGCVCLQMPRARAWEELTGQPALGLLATRSAEVTLLVADTLASLQLPASLAPNVVAFAMQDVIDGARLPYFDDWSSFERAVRELPRDRLTDYIAALAANGPLLPVQNTDGRE